jgi:aromatic ring hydroxylase
MAARIGKQYLEGLKDDRCVWLGDAQVDVMTHPDFAGSRQGMACYFDWQNLYAEDCLAEDQTSCAPMSASLVIPKSARDLEIRHRCLDRLAKYAWANT